MEERDRETAGAAAKRLLDDAALLYSEGRLPSALLLLLCAVDALAPRIAGRGRVGERYISFLRDRLDTYPGPGVKLTKVRVPKTGEMLEFAHIIYKFMRNPIVHEGQALDVRGDGVVAQVLLDLSDKTLVSRVDEAAGALVIGADWLANRLFVILRHELAGV